MPARAQERRGECQVLHSKGIRPETLKSFAGRWHEDDAGRAVFLHETWTRDGDGARRALAVGVESAGASGENCSDSRRQGVWDSGERAGVRRLVVTERAVDALSYHQLHPRDDTRYLSTGGGPLTVEQRVLVTDLALRGVTVVVAFGNTRDGALRATELEAGLPGAARCQRHAPSALGAWNDVVQGRERAWIRTQGFRDQGRGLELDLKR